MCGICGIINYNGEPVKEEKIRAMMRVMKRRGPDDEGVYIADNIGLGFVRLSIIDLSSAGHQPMFSNDGKFVIIFNGEIYNYIELRKELKGFYDFKSNTDTEVILAAYSKWGENCVEKFNGMWAFAVLNTGTKEIFFSRDRFGIKPFYYYSDSKSFFFASDIPPLFELLKNKLSPDYNIIYDFILTNRTNHNDKSFFKGIKRLKQGRNLFLKVNKIDIKRYYCIQNTSEPGFANPAEFRELFRDSVRLQLRSDVPVGSMLSGGLDSSSITSVALNDLNFKDIHTFSAVYGNGEKGDESRFVNEYLYSIKNLHYLYPSSDTLIEDLDDYLNIQSEPIPGTSAYAEYKVMKFAKDYCTVILNGQGPDEIMGGYHYFFGAYFYELLKKFQFINLIREMFFYKSKNHSFLPFKYFLFYLIPGSLQYKFLSKYNNVLNESFNKKYLSENDDFVVDTFLKFDTLKEFFLNHFENKFEHMLLWADKNGMAFSLEARFPFLDHRLIESLYKTNNSMLLKDGVTKIILRNAMSDIVPKNIIGRIDKIGFQTPEDKWLREEKLKNIIFKTISSKSMENRGIVNHEKIMDLFNKHMNKKANCGKELWKLFHLELWFQKYFD